MTAPPIKVNWYDRAIQVHRFHVTQCKMDSTWTINNSALLLNRSIGSVSQDLLIASWSKTHEKQLKRFSTMKDALAFIRTKEREMRLEEL